MESELRAALVGGQGLHLGDPKHPQPAPGVYRGAYSGTEKPQQGGCAIMDYMTLFRDSLIIFEQGQASSIRLVDTMRYPGLRDSVLRRLELYPQGNNYFLPAGIPIYARKSWLFGYSAFFQSSEK